MEVKIMATRDCSHRPNLEQELQDLGVSYEVWFVEDNPEAVERFQVRHSPTLIVDEKVVFHGQPNEHELRDLFAGAGDQGGAL